jgi:DNA-binding transcriptional LysR family regulator
VGAVAAHRVIGYISTQNGRAVPLRFEHEGERTEIKVEYRLGINESNAHLAAAIAGLGIVQTFAHAANSALKEGSLVAILDRWRPPSYPFHVVYPQNRYVTHRLRVFIDWLLECFPVRVRGTGVP